MRSYAADDVISLPTLNAAAAVALGQGLLTAAEAHSPLPPLMNTRLARLEATHAALHQALGHNPHAAMDPQQARNADIAEDQVWAALHDWLLGWSKLHRPETQAARALYDLLFPTRLKFTQLPYKLEWAEADTRLARIAQGGHDALIEKLGGAMFLETLRETHRAYGEALGITAAQVEPVITGLREPLQAFTSSLRAYVFAVAAHADTTDAASVTLVDSLLAPLHKWQSHVAQPGVPVKQTPMAHQS